MQEATHRPIVSGASELVNAGKHPCAWAWDAKIVYIGASAAQIFVSETLSRILQSFVIVLGAWPGRYGNLEFDIFHQR